MGDKVDLIRAVAELLADYRQNQDTWENNTLELYLEALLAWLRDTEARKEPLTFGFVIQMLQAAKIYE